MAKFKVGDEVKVGNPHLADRGRYGRVVSAGVDGNPLLYDVDLGGGVQLFSESDLVAANASRNAKFTKGQKVVLTPSGLSYHGKNLEGVVGVIEGEYDDGEFKGLFLPSYWIGGELGRRLPKAMEGSKDVSRRVSEENIRLANSARACNATYKLSSREAKAGDLVKVAGALGTYRVTKVIGKDIEIQDVEDTGYVDRVEARFATPINNARACNSRNQIVAKALNAALPIGDIGVSDSTILWRMIDGGRDEPYHDEYQKRLDKMNQRDIPEDTISILKKYGYKFKNSSAKASREKAVNAKFNVGDRVRIKNPNRQIGQDDGTYEVTLIRPDGMISIKAPSEKVGFAVRPEQLIANAVRNAAGYVDASSVALYPGDAVVFKAGYRLHSDDDEWLERNGDTVREVRGDEVKIGPSANDWAKIKDLMVWHNSVRTTNAVVARALNACGMARNGTWDASVVRRMLDEGRRLASSGSAAAKKKWSDEMYRQTLSHGGEIPRELDLLWSSPAFAAYARDPDEF